MEHKSQPMFAACTFSKINRRTCRCSTAYNTSFQCTELLACCWQDEDHDIKPNGSAERISALKVSSTLQSKSFPDSNNQLIALQSHSILHFLQYSQPIFILQKARLDFLFLWGFFVCFLLLSFILKELI